MNTITAIPTIYAGTQFRSRLEARWAVFFDTIGLEWEYEPEAYTDGETSYLPDFWMPGIGMFFEVKPNYIGSDAEFQVATKKAKMLASGSHRTLVMSYGPPSDGYNLVLFPTDCECEWGKVLVECGPYAIREDRRDDGVFWLEGAGGNAFTIGPGKGTNHDRWPVFSEKLIHAQEKARTYRFR